MSVNSVRQTSRTSNGAGISSISSIIQLLRSAFRDDDYRDAERKLMEREENLRRSKDEALGILRDKCDAFEAELAQMKTEKFIQEEEIRQLRRKSEVSDDQLNELARDLSIARDKEEKSGKRYDALLEHIRVLEAERKGLVEKMATLRDEKEELKMNLRGNATEIDEIVRVNVVNVKEMEVIKRANELLKEDKERLVALLEEVKKDTYKRIRELSEENEVFEVRMKEVDGLLRRVTCLETEKMWLEKEKLRLEDQAKETEALHKRIALLEEEKLRFEDSMKEVEDLRRKSDCLEAEKEKLNASFEECRRNDARKTEEMKEVLEKEKLESLREKDERIQELEKEKEGLAIELKEVAAKTEQAENRLLKLERDFMSTICCDMKRVARFSSSQSRRILSVIAKALDSEGIGLACNALEADSAFVPKVNESKVFLKSERKSEEDIKRNLVFEAEVVKENGASGQKGTTVNNIIIVDSDDDDDDDDDENSLCVSGVKRKYGHSENLNEQCDSSKDDGLKQKHIKKLKHGSCEPVKSVSSIPSAAGDGHKFSISQREIPVTIRKRIEKPGGDIGECGKEDENSNSNFKENKANKACSPKLEEYMATRLQRKENKKLEVAADMFCAFDEDDDFCAKAVCALYRQHKSKHSSMKGSVCVSSMGFEEFDADRGISLAKFLIDGDLLGKVKKSVSELLQHDQNGLVDCRRLAKKYSKQLIDIYKKGEDPLFSPLSADLQYK